MGSISSGNPKLWQGFPLGFHYSTIGGGGGDGENGQKRHENQKINIFRGKQCVGGGWGRRGMGDKPIFGVVEEVPPLQKILN